MNCNLSFRAKGVFFTIILCLYSSVGFSSSGSILDGCFGISSNTLAIWIRTNGGNGKNHLYYTRKMVAKYAAEYAQSESQIPVLVPLVVGAQKQLRELNAASGPLSYEKDIYRFAKDVLAVINTPNILEALNAEIAKQETADAINESFEISSFKARLGDNAAIAKLIDQISAEQTISGRVATSQERADLMRAAYAAGVVKNPKMIKALINSVVNYSNKTGDPLASDEGSVLISRTNSLMTLSLAMGSKEGLEAILSMAEGKTSSVASGSSRDMAMEGVGLALIITDLEIHPDAVQFFKTKRAAGASGITRLYDTLVSSHRKQYYDRLFTAQD